jgi:hypothetical protein
MIVFEDVNRWVRILAGVAVFAIATTIPAWASAWVEERPVLLPQMDGAIVYHLTSDARNAPEEFRFRFKAGGSLLRIDLENQPGYILIDRGQKQAAMVMERSHLAMQLPVGDLVAKYLSDPSAHFKIIGSNTIGRIPCVEWSMNAPDAQGQGCVTDDGLILRASGFDHRGQHAAIEAVAITLAPQPETDFHTPVGVRALDLSNLSGLAKSFRLPQ